MEDTSYVNLSLQKYNELYDKAKKYDELTKELGDKISESISTIVDNFNKMFTTDEEHSGETEEQEDEDTEFKVGDKVKLVKHSECTNGINLGDICKINDINESGSCRIEIDNGITLGYVDEEHIEKIKEEK